MFSSGFYGGLFFGVLSRKKQETGRIIGLKNK
jgi:hypothetical protein